MAERMIGGSISGTDYSYAVYLTTTTLKEENATRVTARVCYKRSGVFYGTVRYRFRVGILTQSGSKTFSAATGEVELCTLPNVLVSHAESGEGTLEIVMEASVDGTDLSFSRSVPLETVDRTSVIDRVASGVIGDGATFSYTVKSTLFSHRVEVSFGAASVAHDLPSAAEYTRSAKAELPLSFATQIPNATVGTGTLTLVTLYEGRELGRVSTAFSAALPQNEETAPSVTLSASPDYTYAGFLLQGKTRFAATATGEAKLGASVTAREILFEGKTYASPATTDPVTGAGTLVITARVTDSRGFVSEASQSVSVTAYAAPKLLPVSGEMVVVKRTGGSGLHIAAKASCSPLVKDGASWNGATLKCRIRERTVSNFGGWITLGAREFNGVVEGVSLLATSSYVVELCAFDSVGSETTASFAVSTEEVCFHLREGGLGAAFGKYAESERVLEISPDWTLRLHGNVEDAVTLTDVAGYAAESAPYLRVRLLRGNTVQLQFSAPLDFAGERVLLAPAVVEEAFAPLRAVRGVAVGEGGALVILELSTAGDLYATHVIAPERTPPLSLAFVEGVIEYEYRKERV